MKPKKFRAGLAILAGGLSFVGSASAVDIAIDGGYESAVISSGVIGIGGNDGAGVDGGRTRFSTYAYSANYTQAGPTGSGNFYLRPYPPGSAGVDNSSQTVSQTVSLVRGVSTSNIDSAQGQYTISAWFCTYHGQNDYSDLSLQFLDEFMSPTGNPIVIGGQAFVAALPGGSGSRAWGQDSKTGLIPSGARFATITAQSHAVVNLPDGYVDLVSLDVTNASVPVQLTSAFPANDATGVSPGAVLNVTLQDGSAALNPTSVVVAFDGAPVTPSINQAGGVTTVQYDPPGLLASLSAHTYQIAYGNAGGATPNTTNQYSFTVAPWVNVELGAPIHLETFDGVAEGSLPAGWSVVNMTDFDIIPGFDLNNFHSDAYLDWVLISRSTLSNLFTVDPGGGDFPDALNVAPNQVVNDALVTNLIDGNFMFAVSDRGDNQKQIQYLFTSDYNLTGHTNVYLVFNSIWTQNQDSLAAVEYSIDGGATWLPGRYMFDAPDILLDTGGGPDGSNTMAFVHADVPNLANATLGNGNFGQFIGVAQEQWATVSAHLVVKANDDHVSSKTVELIRISQADNQPAVRFRFAHVGTWSWYWGIDNVGMYSIATVEPPTVANSPTPAAQTVALGNSASFAITGVLGENPSYQWRLNGTNLPGKITQTLTIPAVSFADAGSYDVVVTNAGGAATSAPPAAVLTVINPAVFVTGQWDFNSNLVASCGQDLQFFDGTVATDTTFATTTDFSIADIGGQPTTVMRFVPSTGPGQPWGGYQMFHGAAPNGGGEFVNQYTIIYDIYYPSSSANTWRSLLQTATGNNNDGDAFVNDTTGGVGISSIYHGNVTPDTWHRVAIAIDLSGPGTHPVLTKFIDGVKVGEQTTGLSNPDGRFSLGDSALLFADNDGDAHEAYVSSVQFNNNRRPDAYIAALGGASASKIPGCISAGVENGNVVVRWTGGVPLQAADDLTGPWTPVNGATSPYTVSGPLTKKYFRPQIP